MNETVYEAVDRYWHHFSNQINQIADLSCESADLFKETLFCSLIDALSRSVFPWKQPRDRFTSLVQRFGRWEHQDRISLPHLARLLQLAPDPAFEKLRRFVLEKLFYWKAPWDVVTLDQDSLMEEVSKYWPRNNEYKMPIEKVRIESLTHLHLLYSYRNSLVHELRQPGYGIDTGERSKPYYHDMSTITHGNEPPLETFELVYPAKFFEKMCNIILTTLRDYMKENQLNPFSPTIISALIGSRE